MSKRFGMDMMVDADDAPRGVSHCRRYGLKSFQCIHIEHEERIGRRKNGRMALRIKHLHIGRAGDPEEIRGCRRGKNNPGGDSALQ
jgi:hypothetical protein